ncbi:MAG: glutamine amidotransferase [Crocinitomix sp.]|jgi:glutamine amidotransferase
MRVAIIDYGAGNTQSVLYALEHLNVHGIITNNREEIQSADKIILPGVGHAKPALAQLKKNKLDELIPTLNQPFLGICLGMQLLCRYIEEGNVNGLNIFETDVYKFKADHIEQEKKIKVPHMGWNNLQALSSPLFKDLKEGSYVYFVHSYYAELNKQTIANCQYGKTFAAAMQQENFYGCQFHPEKSGEAGLQLLKNFIEL